MSKNNPANRGVGDHLKAGLKNIPGTYKTLYNRPKGPGGGLDTIPSNVRVVVKGNTAPGMKKLPGATRAKVAVMGAASVTPLGPVAAFASGVVKSVQDKNKAKAANPKPTNVPKATVGKPIAGKPMTVKSANVKSTASKPGGLRK